VLGVNFGVGDGSRVGVKVGVNVGVGVIVAVGVLVGYFICERSNVIETDGLEVGEGILAVASNKSLLCSRTFARSEK